jgi:hypothetical protein
MEAKIDAILRKIDQREGDRLIRELDESYAGRGTDARSVHQ